MKLPRKKKKLYYKIYKKTNNFFVVKYKKEIYLQSPVKNKITNIRLNMFTFNNFLFTQVYKNIYITYRNII